MIIIKLQGGLGNQLFQYAFGLSLSQKLKSTVYFDVSFFKEVNNSLTARANELHLFPEEINIAGEQQLNSFFHPNLYKKILNKLGVNKSTIYRERSLKFDGQVFDVKPPAYFEGFWQSEKYFIHSEEQIRKSLVFKNSLNPASEKIAALISQQKDAVSVHVRRGDYVSSKTTNELHGVCSVNFYLNAITLIEQQVKAPSFYFFSDDPNWVTKNLLPVVSNPVLVQHNKAAESWQDMALMSKCKHHIIANSSFSWWGAWLNPAKEKIVIAPEKWFNSKTEYYNAADLIPESWTRIAGE